MDDTTHDTGNIDVFSRLLAELHAPATDAPMRAAPPPMPPPAPRAAHSFEPPSAWSGPHAPELLGADELAAPPRHFPPLPIAAPPLTSPPAWTPPPLAVPPVVVSPPSAEGFTAPPPTTSPAAGSSPAAPAPALDFAALLTSPTVSADSNSSAGLPVSGALSTHDDEPDIARPTLGEKFVLVLAVLIPPLGVIAALVGSLVSVRRRGWVVGVLKAALTLGVVLTVIVGFAGYVGYSLVRQQQAHDQTAAQSAAFCATIRANPTMVQLPDFGWPAVATSIPDSLAAMQSYTDRWTKLESVAPPGIKSGVTKVATTAQQIVDGVKVARTIDDPSNVTLMSQAASVSGVPAWYSQYCK
ncbi:MAG: DUF1705 domain-containing protein [Acidobacteria bacterium]|nr:DUF1705 domain-containing protein [Acidobacteriota bacterium]